MAWPEGSVETDRRLVIADALGIPGERAAPLARSAGPAAIATVPEARAHGTVKRFRRHGVRAACCPGGRREGPIRVRRVIAGAGSPPSAFMCLPWRSEGGVGFEASDVLVLVRATLSWQKKGSRLDAVGHDPITGPAGLGSMRPESVYGLTSRPNPARRVLSEHAMEQGRQTSVQTGELLDLHLRDGRWIRCDGRKFSFEDLPERGQGDGRNTDLLAVWIAESAQFAAIDTGFQAFRASGGGLRRARVSYRDPGVRPDAQETLFSLYSELLGREALDTHPGIQGE